MDKRMCLIVYAGKEASFPISKLSTIYSNNRHGFGMMWMTRGCMQGMKGLYKCDEIKYMIKHGPKTQVAYHFRFATRGLVNDDNAHPYIINEKVWMMHNGTLDIECREKDKSDSAAFADILQELDDTHIQHYFLGKNTGKAVANLIGTENRMLFMGYNQEGQRIVNMIGRWYTMTRSGCYISNTYSLRDPWNYMYNARRKHYPWIDDYTGDADEYGAYKDYQKEKDYDWVKEGDSYVKRSRHKHWR
jgi:predicted glutamine amidotransferase